MLQRLRAFIPARKARGQSLVELAISLMVMLLLLAGAVTFGMALFSYVAIRDAAQEGALYGSFNPYYDANGNKTFDSGEQGTVNYSVICPRVIAASNSPVNMSAFGCTHDGATSHFGNNIDVYATNPGNACEDAPGGTPNAIQVRVEYDYQIVMPFFGAVTGGSNSIHLNAVVTDTILEPKCP